MDVPGGNGRNGGNGRTRRKWTYLVTIIVHQLHLNLETAACGHLDGIVLEHCHGTGPQVCYYPSLDVVAAEGEEHTVVH